jgi:hypothetical protein
MDIVQFQGRHKLDKDDVSYYLGIRHLAKKCSEPLLDYSLELLMRLYNENPTPPPFRKDRITLPELFESMYGKHVAAFVGSEYEVEAKVDLQNRFSKLLGRSKGRAYRWLNSDAIEAGTHSDVMGILGKLTQVKNPGETLERLGKMVWALRGEDIDALFPIPTLKSPPVRRPRGRKPGAVRKEEDANGAAKDASKKIRAELVKKPVAKKPSAKKVAPKKAAAKKSKK